MLIASTRAASENDDTDLEYMEDKNGSAISEMA